MAAEVAPAPPSGIGRGLVWRLGFSQLISWGTAYYAIAIFGDPIARDLGWSRATVFGGFSAALLASGAVSALVGRAIDRHGGRSVMVSGSLIAACGFLGVAVSNDLTVYYASWLLLGMAMRMTLYDAAFAALARIGGPASRRAISQITLLGGLASTAFWPIGHVLIDAVGWRAAIACYAVLAVCTVPLHLAIPATRWSRPNVESDDHRAPLAVTRGEIVVAGVLFSGTTTLMTALNAAMSAHMVPILNGLGLSAEAAVSIGALRGIGQSGARLGEVLLGHRLNPLALGTFASGLIPVGFLAGMFSGVAPATSFLFALLYGAGNGLVTITRGTQPLVLFDPHSYGTLVGRLVTPSFFLSALAPVAYALVIDRYGNAAALYLSLAVALAAAALSAALWIRFPIVRPTRGTAAT